MLFSYYKVHVRTLEDLPARSEGRAQEENLYDGSPYVVAQGTPRESPRVRDPGGQQRLFFLLRHQVSDVCINVHIYIVYILTYEESIYIYIIDDSPPNHQVGPRTHFPFPSVALHIGVFLFSNLQDIGKKKENQ